MKINWGTGIVLAFVAFISFILYFVYIALSDPRADHELVTEAYYSKDLEYQQDLTASANLDHFGGNFGVNFGTRSAQEGAKMGPREPSRAPKTQKPAFAKTLKNRQFFNVFGVQRPPKRALGGPRRLPRGSRRAPRPNKKGIQKWAPKLSIFGPILGPFLGLFWRQNWLQKGTNNGTTFGTLFLRLSGVGGVLFCELNESAAKATVTGIILGKRKGGIQQV